MGFHAGLYSGLLNSCGLWAADEEPHELSYEERERVMSTPDIKYSDDGGPLDAWSAGLRPDEIDCVMVNENSWLREQAYVLWDADRLDQYGMFEVFDGVTEESELQKTETDIDEMRESWDERGSKVARVTGARGM